MGTMRRVMISDVVCSNSASSLASIITGIPGHVIEDVWLGDIYIQHQGGGTKENALLQPSENEHAYPEPTMFGPSMPDHGFFIRHARNIHMSNIEIVHAQDDERPAFVLDDVTGADFFRVRAQRDSAAPTFALKQVKDFSVSQSRVIPDTFLEAVEEKKL